MSSGLPYKDKDFYFAGCKRGYATNGELVNYCWQDLLPLCLCLSAQQSASVYCDKWTTRQVQEL